MKKSEFNKLWVALVASFPNAPTLPEATFEAYYAALARYPLHVVADGIRRFLDESGADFFPSLPKLAQWIREPVEPGSAVEVAIDRAIRDERLKLTARLGFMRQILADFDKPRSKEGDGNKHVFTREWVHSADPWRDRWRWRLEPAQTEGKSICSHGTRVSMPGSDVQRGLVCASCIAFVVDRSDLRTEYPDHFVHHLLNSFRVIAGKLQAAGELTAGNVEVDE